MGYGPRLSARCWWSKQGFARASRFVSFVLFRAIPVLLYLTPVQLYGIMSVLIEIGSCIRRGKGWYDMKARVTLTCATCGKLYEVVRNVRNAAEADRWEATAGNYYTECPDCYKARLAAERDAANAAAADAAADYQWPALNGSDKQVAWAETIRLQMIDKLTPDKVEDEFHDLFARCLDRFLADHTDAAWWIDNRNSYRAIKTAFVALVKEMHDADVSAAAQAPAADATNTSSSEDAAEAPSEEIENTPAHTYTVWRQTIKVDAVTIPELLDKLIPANYTGDDPHIAFERVYTCSDEADARAELDRKSDTATVELSRSAAGYSATLVTYYLTDRYLFDHDNFICSGDYPVLLTPSGDYRFIIDDDPCNLLDEWGHWELIDD